MKVVAIVQARMGSTRFPNKVMKSITGTPMIGLLFERLTQSNKIDEIVLATSIDPKNENLSNYVKQLGHTVYRGSETDVLDRYYQAAKQVEADIVVRITGDCPVVDSALVDELISQFLEQSIDYVSNIDPPTFPDGLDVEVMRFETLAECAAQAKSLQDREHVTSYIRKNAHFKKKSYSNDSDDSNERWTVDEPEDFEVVEAIFQHFHPKRDFSWLDVMKLRQEKPQIFKPNQYIARNEGVHMNTGQKLWKRAKNVIPGGNMLLSKRAEMFLPDAWPAYFSQAKGCKVWDLDGNEYIDMSTMSVGTNLLGYCHPEVDAAAQETIAKSNMSTLNCPEEVYLAERLIELHPWADMARFARSGGEANAIAIRIARAASGKDKVAFCGYHGWHDWYLAANLGDEKQLSEHLLPGLAPNGIPENLRHTIYPFQYNRLDELQALVAEHDIGVIKMEVSRNEAPAPGFLEAVRQLATDKGIVLIFDECTSGFRQTDGGLHKLYGVEPDMAVFGKALGNGYAITATIGRREVMEAAQTSFISSTFWTERLGPTAGLKVLEVMGQLKSWDLVTQMGNKIRKRWLELAEKYGLNLKLLGIPALSGFAFDGPNGLAYKTLITQELLAKGFLAANSVYLSTAHTDEVVNAYFEALEPVFALIAECEAGQDVMNLLKSPVCHAGFKRLN